MARKAKYSEEWQSRAAALQAKIGEAMTLATSSIGDYGWLHQLHSWVMEVAQSNARTGGQTWIVKYPSPEKKSGSVRSSRHKGSASHPRCACLRRLHEANAS